MTGFVNFLKPPQMSSMQAVSLVKRISAQKAGHLGTLDRCASGVLPIALGRATALFDILAKKVKVYRAIFRFGIETDTLDLDGVVTAKLDKKITLNEINDVLPKLTGKIAQIPPIYSTKKVNGKRSHTLARAGIEINLKPSNIEIYKLKAKKIENNEFLFEIECSGGTYIRSLARDIARYLDTYAVMICLIREKSGFFDINTAQSPKELDEGIKIIKPEEVLCDLPRIDVMQTELKRALNGACFEGQQCNIKAENYTVFYNDILLGIAKDFNGMKKIDIKLIDSI